MVNPFDDDTLSFLVLINAERQHSLWPENIKLPDGWTVAFGPDKRANCLGFVEESWTDMRPASLVTQMKTESPVSAEPVVGSPEMGSTSHG